MSKKPLAQRLLEFAFSQREAYAAELFAIEGHDGVAMRLKAAAAKGVSHLRLTQDKPVGLDMTEAAFALTAWLDANGFGYRWSMVTEPETRKGKPTGIDCLLDDLSGCLDGRMVA